MLHEKVNLLLEALDVKGVDIARSADIAPTRVSKLRSGAEVPKQDSSSIRQFVYGILRTAEETGQSQKIYNLIGWDANSDAEKLSVLLTAWLYSDTENTKSQKKEVFQQHFEALLQLSGITLKALSVISETDYSYIFRLHKGERFPRPGSVSVLRICAAVLNSIQTQRKQNALTKLTSIPAELCSPETLRDWLFGTADYSDSVRIRQLIELIEMFDSGRLPELPALTKNSISSEYYFGDSGLQTAVTRFLGSIQPEQELLLYSDQSMDWMTGSYKTQWTALMMKCLKMGVHVRIIHNIDRNIPEMLDAIQSWMPLYLTGLIKPFYNLKEQGTRFQHTLFLCPGNAAVTGWYTILYCYNKIYLKIGS